MGRRDDAVIGDVPHDAVRRVNAARRAGDLRDLERLEPVVEALHGASCRLAVYGSLLPGEENHQEVEALRGTWVDGTVQGTLEDRGWGARAGYPGIRIGGGPGAVPVKVLVSEDLPRAWPRLDVFEGDEYVRVLAFVALPDGKEMVANIYELRDLPPDAAPTAENGAR